MRYYFEYIFNRGIVLSKLYFWLSLVFGFKISSFPKFITKKLENNSIVIDLGANVGNVIKPLMSKPIIIHCYEPNPFAFNELTNMISSNQKKAGVKVFQEAISNFSGISQLYCHQFSDKDPLLYSQGSSLISEKKNVDLENFFDVKTVTVKQVFERVAKKKVHILKMDIEGAEIDVLNDIIDNELYNQVEYIFVETHERKMEQEHEINSIKKRMKDKNISNIYLNWI